MLSRRGRSQPCGPTLRGKGRFPRSGEFFACVSDCGWETEAAYPEGQRQSDGRAEILARGPVAKSLCKLGAAQMMALVHNAGKPALENTGIPQYIMSTDPFTPTFSFAEAVTGNTKGDFKMPSITDSGRFASVPTESGHGRPPPLTMSVSKACLLQL